jgi:hypothetical protein
VISQQRAQPLAGRVPQLPSPPPQQQQLQQPHKDLLLLA